MGRAEQRMAERANRVNQMKKDEAKSTAPTPPAPPAMGDVVFFKTAKKESGPKSYAMTFQGHGFGVFLGHVPKMMPDPDPGQLLRMMGQIGFLTFDDVGTFLGEEMAAKCVKMYEDKYYGKEAQDAAPEIPVVATTATEGSRLVDTNGSPLHAAPSMGSKDETAN